MLMQTKSVETPDQPVMVRNGRLTEDWLAVLIGLSIFVLSLVSLAGVDVFGWVVKTSVWLNPAKIMAPVSGKYS